VVGLTPGPRTHCWARWVERPDSGGVVLTGSLSVGRNRRGWRTTSSTGWCCSPAPGFVELALRAGDEVGCSMVDELTLLAPFGVTARAALPAVQVVVDAAGESGSRAVWVYSRGAAPDSVWVLHAQGRVEVPRSPKPAADLSVWPPVGGFRGRCRRRVRGAGGPGATTTGPHFAVSEPCGRAGARGLLPTVSGRRGA